ncbi:uncharacterized protein PAC_13882 [Phialocephala subalpina]|uniref:F-box domain-containing protein n=1 Tax=Phialocephala subalpina TaxID=576137 RepID=A0A1L7XG18_9HELO|nr:uncharacterized protein PAC_13882 [Phialocephala subalpina]
MPTTEDKIMVDAPQAADSQPHPESLQVTTVTPLQTVFQTFELDKKLGAAASIFRFQDLPLELRMKIYDYMVFANPFRKININSPYTKTGLSSLMQTCKQLYEETKPFFYKNNFNVHDPRSKAISYILPSFKEQVKKPATQQAIAPAKKPPSKKAAVAKPNRKPTHVEYEENEEGETA